MKLLNSLKKSVMFLAVIGLITCMSGVNQAGAASFTFNNVGDMVTFNYSLDVGGGNILTGTTKYVASAIAGNGIILATTVTNTSTTGTNQGLKSVGFQTTDPMLSAAALTQVTPLGDTNVFSNALVDVTFPGFQQVELCVLNGNNCSGGAQGTTLGEGQTDTFLLTLFFASSPGNPPMFTIDGPRIRYKGDLGSFTFAGNGNCGPNDPSCTSTPEPGTVLLLGTGLAGLGIWRWKTKK